MVLEVQVALEDLGARHNQNLVYRVGLEVQGARQWTLPLDPERKKTKIENAGCFAWMQQLQSFRSVTHRKSRFPISSLLASVPWIIIATAWLSFLTLDAGLAMFAFQLVLLVMVSNVSESVSLPWNNQNLAGQKIYLQRVNVQIGARS